MSTKSNNELKVYQLIFALIKYGFINGFRISLDLTSLNVIFKGYDSLSGLINDPIKWAESTRDRNLELINMKPSLHDPESQIIQIGELKINSLDTPVTVNDRGPIVLSREEALKNVGSKYPEAVRI